MALADRPARLLVAIAVVGGVAFGVFLAGGGPQTSPAIPTPGTSGARDPFQVYAIALDERPENATLSHVDPLPDPVARAVANANQPGDLHDERFEYVAVSRSAFRAALRAFRGERLPEMTPGESVYYVRRNGTVYEIHFDVVTE